MSNINELNLYLVTDGEATEATPETEWDGETSVLVASTSPENALNAAKAYDDGLIGFDTIMWCGEPLGVVALRDEVGNII